MERRAMADGFLQVLGLLRWSYPSEVSAFAAEAEDLDARRRQLYHPARMEERLFFLEHVTLPCLRQQTDPNFRIVMLLGDQLPDPWRARVLGLIDDIPQITPRFEREGKKHAYVCRQTLRLHRMARAAAVAEFRLDDDDAMALDFVAETRRIFRQHRRLLADHPAFCIDYTKGFALIAEGEELRVRPVFAHLVGIAQALIYPPDHPRSVLDYPHRRIWTTLPTISLPEPAKWLRGVHRTNDSGIANTVDALPTWRCAPERFSARLRSHFAVDLDAARQAWAELQRHTAPPG